MYAEKKEFIDHKGSFGELLPGQLFNFIGDPDLCMKVEGTPALINLMKKRPSAMDECSFYVNLDKYYVNVVHNSTRIRRKF